MRLQSIISLASLTTASPLLQEKNTNQLSPREPKVSYDNHHVYSIAPSSAQEAHDLSKRFERHHTQPIRDKLSVVIAPEEVEEFEALHLNARLVNSDLGAYIRSIDAKTSPSDVTGSVLEKRGPGELPDLSWFDGYHAYEEHLKFWDGLVEAFEGNAEKFEIGRSWEGRSIWAFRLFGDEEEGAKRGGKKGGKGGDGEGEGKPIILWHATVHAREVCCCFVFLVEFLWWLFG